MEEGKSLSIKSWAKDDRPREKLMDKGKETLSNAELIAILLGSGTPNVSAVDLAKKILKSVDNNLNELGRKTINDLTRFKGIGEAKAVSIITALELGNRRRHSEALQRKKITQSEDAFEVMQPLIGDLHHEEFWAIYVNSHNKILSVKSISKGGLTGTLADARMIFKEAIMINATGIILIHNHPSGNTNPSRSDHQLTKKLLEAGRVMDVNILDHIIVTEKQYYSFADEGHI